MQTRVEFKSRAFPKYPDEDEETVNETRWGKRLAEYVRDQLPTYGIPTEGILCEDWGWLVNIKNDEFPLWIGCGPVDDFDEDPPGSDELIEFALFVAAEPKLLQRLFKKIDTRPAVEKVTAGLRAMVAAAPEFENPEWSS
jgi:hypothetical protein